MVDHTRPSPITLRDQYPRTAFEQAQAAMAPFAKMVDAISRDHDWLCKQLESYVSD